MNKVVDAGFRNNVKFSKLAFGLSISTVQVGVLIPISEITSSVLPLNLLFFRITTWWGLILFGMYVDKCWTQFIFWISWHFEPTIRVDRMKMGYMFLIKLDSDWQNCFNEIEE